MGGGGGGGGGGGEEGGRGEGEGTHSIYTIMILISKQHGALTASELIRAVFAVLISVAHLSLIHTATSDAYVLV